MYEDRVSLIVDAIDPEDWGFGRVGGDEPGEWLVIVGGDLHDLESD